VNKKACPLIKLLNVLTTLLLTELTTYHNVSATFQLDLPSIGGEREGVIRTPGLQIDEKSLG